MNRTAGQPSPPNQPPGLSPASYLLRAASVFGDRTAVVDGERRFTYAELSDRVLRLGSALAEWGVGPGDRVLAIAANSHPLLELHNAVPLAGSVLVALNTRLSAAEKQTIGEHCRPSVVVATEEYADDAAALGAVLGIPVVVSSCGGPDDEYDAAIAANPVLDPPRLDGDLSLLALNYTSGTTGGPKGVMYHHRGAFLQAMAMAYHAGLGPESRYLWTLPMFHCNGWCFTWGVTAAGGTHVCLRSIDPDRIWTELRDSGITHLSAAPTVLSMIAEAGSAPLDHVVTAQTGGAPPSPTLIGRLSALGLETTHLYGLTETFGPIVVNQWQAAWDELPDEERHQLRARQGVPNIASSPVRVVGDDGATAPHDGTTVGEVQLRGNTVMLGYYRNDEANAEAFDGEWFRTGDLGVMHPDGYLELTDRAKDIIISGGENIASVEVERALDTHPGVVESAVVARPDKKWGEVPVAFVSTRGEPPTSEELIAHLRGQLAGYKVPRTFVFGELPKTSTGKIRKQALREQLDDERDSRP